MVLSTTPTIEGSPIREYKGIVTGETIIGANVFKDFMAGLRDFFGGRSGTYEKCWPKQRTHRCRRWPREHVRWVPTPWLG